MNQVTIDQGKKSYQMVEEMKTLRTNIQFCGGDKKVIMITSCIQAEGKSSTCLDLAVSLAGLNKRVLLLDVDLRKNTIVSEIKETQINKGLTHFLSGQCSFNEILYSTNVKNLTTIFSGIIPPNPTELLESKIFSVMMDKLRDSFDYVIVDTPPLGMVVDAAIISKKCDASILLLESGNIKYKMAQETKRKLESTGCPVLGVILNKVDYKKTNKYYGGRYYGKDYEKRYKHYYEKR